MISLLSWLLCDAINIKLYNVCKEAADRGKNNAALEVRKVIKNDCNKDDIIDCGVSIDRSWQRRDFSSVKGVAVAACHDNTKVIGSFFIKVLRSLTSLKKKGTVEYEQ